MPANLRSYVLDTAQDGEAANYRAATLANLLYDQLSALSEGDRWDRATMDRAHVLLDAIQAQNREINGAFKCLFNAALQNQLETVPGPSA